MDITNSCMWHNRRNNVCRTYQTGVFRLSGGGGLKKFFAHVFDSFIALFERNSILLIPLSVVQFTILHVFRGKLDFYLQHHHLSISTSALFHDIQ